MQQERERSTPREPTFAHEPALPRSKIEAAEAPVGVAQEDITFLTVLVTPKLTFSMQRQPGWKTASDIPQDELREAFLSRFPVRFDTSHIIFSCATPGISLRGLERLVFRITIEGVDDERLLPKILSDVDKAYAVRYDKKIEEARADMISSSMSFQVVADEIRSAQEASAKKWDKEARSLKEQMSTNQKRLFLLEREKEGLQKAATASDELNLRLHKTVEALTHDNTALKERQSDLESQVQALREAVAQHLTPGQVGVAASSTSGVDGSSAGGGGSASADNEGHPCTVASVGTQTQSEEAAAQSEALSRLAVEQWQQQLSVMSEWLRTGAELLTTSTSGAGGGGPQEGAIVEQSPEAGGEPSSIC